MAVPKKPLTSYMQFSADVRADIKAENPDAKITEIAKLIGQRWKETDDATKAKYKEGYEEKMKTYKDEVETWKEENPDADSDDLKGKKRKAKGAKGKGKKKKDPNAPKRPLSAYFIWLGETRAQTKAENPDLNNKELVSKLGEMWGELSDSDKAPFQEKADEAKEEYKKALEEYNNNKADDDDEDEDDSDDE